ncbi:MAG TPA: hypothetical protein VNJ01_11185 [Bacteriovoracaceae bacterium]|nr:hypothetical protein [Bacteriovoracaceae bacterium]
MKATIFSLLILLTACKPIEELTNKSKSDGYVTLGNEVTGGDGSGAVVTESFIQTDTKDLEILWVIDNSGSMQDEQAAVASNLSKFANSFVNKDINFTMAITTTDDVPAGVLVNGSDTLTSDYARSDAAGFLADFQDMIQVGITGSYRESSLLAITSYAKNYPHMIKEDAYLAVVILTDEEDSSPLAVSQYVNELKALKKNAGLVKIFTICDVNKTNTQSGTDVGCVKDAEASRLTNGVVSDIRGNFSGILTSMGDNLANIVDSFALAHKPVLASLRVFVGGDLVPADQYSYNDATGSIRFVGQAPAVGAEVKVVYRKR